MGRRRSLTDRTDRLRVGFDDQGPALFLGGAHLGGVKRSHERPVLQRYVRWEWRGPVVNRDGRLLGFHQTTIEEARMQKSGESLRDTKPSQADGYAQLCCGVLMSEVTKMLDSVSQTERS